MWFSEKALVFVDTRSAAIAVYKKTLSGLRLERFAFERFESSAGQSSLFSNVLVDSKDSLARLARDLKAPLSDVTLLLPVGASFPSIVDLSSLTKGQSTDVEEDDVVRFRIAPLLPFPVAQAEVRTESGGTLGANVTLAQAIPRVLIAEGERSLESLGFSRISVTTALSAALRGLSSRAGVVDLIFGDSACALILRDGLARVEAIHLRLLLPGDDRARRSVDEAIRASNDAREIRVVGETADALRQGAPRETTIHGAFQADVARGLADPQRFPFLGLFHEGTAA